MGMAYSFLLEMRFWCCTDYMRHRLDETPVFPMRLKAAGRVIGGKEERPVKVVREQWRSIC